MRCSRCTLQGWEIVNDIIYKPAFKRTSKFAELFSGQGELTRHLNSIGYPGVGYDKVIHPSLDILTLPGLVFAILIVCSVCPGGLVWISPPRETWMRFDSAFRCERHEHDDFRGNQDRWDVWCANIIAFMCGKLANLAISRECKVVIEHPVRSRLWLCPQLITHFDGCVLYGTCSGYFGWPSLRHIDLCTNIPGKTMKKFMVRTTKHAIRKMPKGTFSRPKKYSTKKAWKTMIRRSRVTPEYKPEFVQQVGAMLQHLLK